MSRRIWKVVKTEARKLGWLKQKKDKKGKKTEKQKEEEKIKKVKTINIKKVVEEQEIWDNKEEVVILEKEVKKLVPE